MISNVWKVIDAGNDTFAIISGTYTFDEFQPVWSSLVVDHTLLNFLYGSNIFRVWMASVK